MSDKDSGMNRRPVILIILDGFGVNPSKAHNAVVLAPTPRLDTLFAENSHATLQASGRSVGLPDGQMGNSEVGHMTMGSGCVIRQDLVLIDDAIADRSFFENRALVAAARRAAAQGRPLHLMGLVSDGGVHSHTRHLTALIKLAKRNGVRPVLHMITDGRDTPPRAALDYLGPLEESLAAADGTIATVSGRYYAMDRDNRWDRTQMAFDAVVHHKGRSAASAREAIENAYAAGEDDEFICPAVIDGGEALQDDDTLVFFNFRKDRPRQTVSALFNPDFDDFDRGGFRRAEVTCMMEYDQWYGLPVAFDHESPSLTLGEIISDAGLSQLHCAETEKYAHVTFFFNGGQSDPYPKEDRILIPSPKVATYDLQPEMSAPAVADALVGALNERKHAFIVANFANGDMVGHTAVREAIIEAVTVLDREVGRVIEAARENGYSVLLTADHGNCDEMIDPISGEPHTRHTCYPVPCLVIDEMPWILSVGGGIVDIAPTVLTLMGLPVPAGMQGKSLLLKPAKR
ncbi:MULTISPECIES: 2,3-bisphosphoglycerate-independent phosphoglycerate mutase [Thiorhodovibrio]|uniref:2,3-bisphosphoglycerate-independent phosphoglycerate mutase n=1 Tax=Thiorhodovibrio TaxID=61593 RepID=UPI001914A867|nr:MULTISPECIES: 2,3-bisphosphoglycerate-independent phosphoglycerate mutase [Thiorhodovibrio]MBK5967698.1 phosphoglycerate mutase (2,3-diphosphoglycerate-independent) [Thiorhodovibrio winogradskyi]WPL11646.1 2,3-bisphosphoglycerate-independent phosphoglycerate mutase [Thiorhodovibrio litoralis]